MAFAHAHKEFWLPRAQGAFVGAEIAFKTAKNPAYAPGTQARYAADGMNQMADAFAALSKAQGEENSGRELIDQ